MPWQASKYFRSLEQRRRRFGFRAVAANNATGIVANGTGATVRIAQSMVTGNTNGWSMINGGVLLSDGDNTIEGNLGNGSPDNLRAEIAPDISSATSWGDYGRPSRYTTTRHCNSGEYRPFRVNRDPLAECPSLPVCTQLRTWRCTTITDAKCRYCCKSRKLQRSNFSRELEARQDRRFV